MRRLHQFVATRFHPAAILARHGSPGRRGESLPGTIARFPGRPRKLGRTTWIDVSI
jgi:hypothetical protein